MNTVNLRDSVSVKKMPDAETQKNLTFLVIGCGSIGKRHAENLLGLGQRVLIYDKDADKMAALVKAYPDMMPYDVKSHHIKIDAFIICTPPNLHIPFAFEGLEHDSHLFIEKPLSHNMDRVDELLHKAEEMNRVVQIGYQLRFNKGLKLVKKMISEGKIGKVQTIRAEFGQYLPNWHMDEDYQNLYTAHKDEGGGIILDASHEIDYVCWLINELPRFVVCKADKLSDLNIDCEDTAEIILRFDDILASIHVDMIQRDYIRCCRITGTKGWLYWGYLEDTVVLNGIAEARHKPNLVLPNSLNFTRFNPNHDYLAEMGHFIESILEIKAGNKLLPNISTNISVKGVLEIVLKTKEIAGV